MNARHLGAWISVALGILLALALLVSRAVAPELVYPVERGVRTVARAVSTRLTGAWRGFKAASERDRLQREVAALSLLKGDLERLEAENSRFRTLLDYKTRVAGDWIPAAVLSSGGGAASSHDVLRVDKGSNFGIVVGAAVVVPEGLVGRVSAVTPHTAEVRLLSDPTVKVSCELETGEATPPVGILSGGSDEGLLLKHLTLLEEPPPRTRVLTSGLGGVFPRGLEVGVYLSQGRVLPAVDPDTLDDVFIRREK